jgi:ATPase subunit of ABC transporter with duplicated ATPase domains
LVSHDRSFINTICQELIILRDQTLTYHRGDLNSYTQATASKKLYLTRMKEAQDKQKSHIQATIAQNIKAGKASGDDNKLKQAKSRQKKLDQRWGMERSEKGTRFKLNRDLEGFHLTNRDEIDIPQDEKGVNITLPPAPDLRFPGPLLSLENVSFKYPLPPGKRATPANPQPTILESINLTIHQSDRIGIVGLNGSGKSTLLNLLTEVTKPTRGTFTKHPRLRLGYYSQHSVEDLQALGRATPEHTALSLLTADVAGEMDEGAIRGLLGSLGLPGRIASDVPLTKLSGGQLVRLALARLLWKSPQLLILDEITTHLDFYTVSALADALGAWNGSVLLVSHDRWMVGRVVENLKDEDEDDEDDGGGREEDDEEELKRRRVVYLLKAGTLRVLEKGVQGFEESLEKRVTKLMNT